MWRRRRGGFQLAFELTIAAPPDKVFATLIDPESWWNPEHTYSGIAANLHLDPRPGGCWCETLPGSGGVQHMTVLNIAPGKRLVLSGALGPLQSAGVVGAMSWKLAPAPKGTIVTLTYDVGGHVAGGLAALAPSVDGVLSELVLRLQAQAETGKPVAAPVAGKP